MLNWYSGTLWLLYYSNIVSFWQSVWLMIFYFFYIREMDKILTCFGLVGELSIRYRSEGVIYLFFILLQHDVKDIYLCLLVKNNGS